MVVRWFARTTAPKEMTTMTVVKLRPALDEIKSLLSADKDFLKPVVRTVLQEVLEAEMTEALGAAKGERVEGRLGYRSGHYCRSLVTRIGKIELRVPQDRQGRFSTELFERYQRSEKALMAALTEIRICRGRHTLIYADRQTMPNRSGASRCC